MRNYLKAIVFGVGLFLLGVTPFSVHAADGAPMYRMYNPNSGEHFYTQSSAEKNHLTDVGWNYEGIGWQAPYHSNTPVYRLYNPNAGDHHYTINAAERNSLVRVGWNYEGIGWYSDDSKGIPIYRQYNKNARSGSHNYTASKAENDTLARSGWRAEGIGWYGQKSSMKEAYLSILKNWRNLEKYADTDYEKHYFQEDYGFDGYYLYDLNQDRKPELFVTSSTMGLTVGLTYRNGTLDCIFGPDVITYFDAKNKAVATKGHWHGAGGDPDTEWEYSYFDGNWVFICQYSYPTGKQYYIDGSHAPYAQNAATYQRVYNEHNQRNVAVPATHAFSDTTPVDALN